MSRPTIYIDREETLAIFRTTRAAIEELEAVMIRMRRISFAALIDYITRKKLFQSDIPFLTHKINFSMDGMVIVGEKLTHAERQEVEQALVSINDRIRRYRRHFENRKREVRAERRAKRR